jgi:AraC family transcriptional regulator, ethanolamine operon transcriptional activator
MTPLPSPATVVRHSQRIITEADQFNDAVSGMSLTVEFQRRQVRASRVEQFQSADWALDFGEAHVTTCTRGVLPPGWASLCLVRGPGGSTWNGLAGEPGTLCCVPPNEELDGRTAPGFVWTTVSISPVLWAQCRLLAGIEHMAFDRFAAFRLPAQQFAQIKRQLRITQRRLRSACDSRPASDPRRAIDGLSDAAHLATHLATTACELSNRAQSPRDSLRNRARLARRAAAWMREHLAEPVRVSDLCLALQVSRREVEYAFRVLFDVSPHEFLHTLRLNAIRRVLLSRGYSGNISTLLLEHGLTHPGRFAADYRAVFGERPSETSRG